jgi:hypothetical protein
MSALLFSCGGNGNLSSDGSDCGTRNANKATVTPIVEPSESAFYGSLKSILYCYVWQKCGFSFREDVLIFN